MRTIGRDRQTLIFDGDDTLWENNVYFERAIDDFIAYLDHSTLSPVEVRAVLDEIERANIRVHGYGAAMFGRSLRECSEYLHQRHLDEAELAPVMRFAERILSQPMEVIAGVEETLAALASRHQVALLTKGHDEEQRLKIERSGLTGFFSHALVVPEKDDAVYRGVVDDLDARPGVTWMIGIRPAPTSTRRSPPASTPSSCRTTGRGDWSTRSWRPPPRGRVNCSCWSASPTSETLSESAAGRRTSRRVLTARIAVRRMSPLSWAGRLSRSLPSRAEPKPRAPSWRGRLSRHHRRRLRPRA